MMEFDEGEMLYGGHGWVGRPDREMLEIMRHHMERERDFDRHMFMNRRRRRSSEEGEENQIREEDIFIEEKDDKIYFEDLLHFPKKLYEKNSDIENDMNIQSIHDFKKEKIDKLKEDIFYYCASPEILNKLSKTIEEEKTYKINQDLNTKNFLFSQKIKNIILNDKEAKLKNIIREQKLSNFNKELPKKLSNLNFNEDEKNKEIENCSLITNKIDDIFFNYNEKGEEEIMDDLRQLEQLIIENKVSMNCLGFLTYNLLEINLYNLFNSIAKKFEAKTNNENILKDFLIILISVNKKVKSVKLLLILIEFCDSHNKILESFKQEQINLDQFISKDCINFGKLFNQKNIKNRIKVDFNLFWNKEEIKEKIKNLNVNNYNNYLTLHNKEYLFVFLNYKNKEVEGQESFQNTLFYLKINIEEGNVVSHGKIELTKKKEEAIIDMNISIKNEFIYIFYLIKKSKKEKYLKCEIYNQSTLGLIKEEQIDIKNHFCNKLLNDSKYLYCLSFEENSKSFEVLIIQKKLKLNYQKSAKLLIYLEKEQIEDNIFLFQMYNNLSINNLFILELLDEKYLAQFSIKKDNEYILNIFQLNNSNINEDNLENKNIKLSYNNNRFLLTKIDKKGFLINISQKENNNLIDEGILLLPFNSNNYYDFSFSKNIYENLLKEYSLYLNLYGNFDLLSQQTEKYLVENNFIYCFNFKEYILDFVTKKIMKLNDKEENLEIKLYYLIILKQTISAMYNTGIFKEKKILSLFGFLKEFIIKQLKEKNNSKMFNKILMEIIYIMSYINESNIIEITDVEKYIKNSINKTNFLLIELLFEQKITQKQDELYKILINFDKEFLINTFNNTEKKNNIIHHYSLYNHIIKKSTEILFLSYFNNDDKLKNLIQLIETLISNIKEILNKYIEYYKKSENIFKYSLLYNSFNFRFLYFIIQNIISKNIFIENKIIKPIQDIFLFFDKIDLKDNLSEFLDLNSLYEIRISSLKDLNDLQY